MTTGKKEWAIGRAVERALALKESFAVYQHRTGANEWTARNLTASEPRDFVRRFTVTGHINTATVFTS